MSYLEENESNMTKVGGYFIFLIQRSGNTFLKGYSHENKGLQLLCRLKKRYVGNGVTVREESKLQQELFNASRVHREGTHLY